MVGLPSGESGPFKKLLPLHDNGMNIFACVPYQILRQCAVFSQQWMLSIRKHVERNLSSSHIFFDYCYSIHCHSFKAYTKAIIIIKSRNDKNGIEWHFPPSEIYWPGETRRRIATKKNIESSKWDPFQTSLHENICAVVVTSFAGDVWCSRFGALSVCLTFCDGDRYSWYDISRHNFLILIKTMATSILNNMRGFSSSLNNRWNSDRLKQSQPSPATSSDGGTKLGRTKKKNWKNSTKDTESHQSAWYQHTTKDNVKSILLHSWLEILVSMSKWARLCNAFKRIETYHENGISFYTKCIHIS